MYSYIFFLFSFTIIYIEQILWKLEDFKSKSEWLSPVQITFWHCPLSLLANSTGPKRHWMKPQLDLTRQFTSLQLFVESSPGQKGHHRSCWIPASSSSPASPWSASASAAPPPTRRGRLLEGSEGELETRSNEGPQHSLFLRGFKGCISCSCRVVLEGDQATESTY